MKFIFVFLLVFSPFTDLNNIARVNEHKKAAKEAYLLGDFKEAAKHYQFLVDSLGITEENVLLNLANALFKLQDTTNARSNYNSLLGLEATKRSKSIAYQQLGLMDYDAKKYQEALTQFKNSLRNDPTNEDARYNYELLKKLLKEQEEQQKQNQEQDQEQQQDQQDQKNNQGQQNQQNKQNTENKEKQQDQPDQDKQQNQQHNKDGEKSEQDDQEEGDENDAEPENMDPTTAEKLKEMNISEEMAKMILEALKNNEIQYIQQNKRKATKRKKDGKPDW